MRLPKRSKLSNCNGKGEQQSECTHEDLTWTQAWASPNEHHEHGKHECDDVDHRCTFNQHFVGTHELNGCVVDVWLVWWIVLSVHINVAPIAAPLAAVWPKPPCCATWFPIKPPIKLPKNPGCVWGFIAIPIECAWRKNYCRSRWYNSGDQQYCIKYRCNS